MKEKLKILLLEDQVSDAELTLREIRKANILNDHRIVDSKEDFLDALTNFLPDIILSDHSLPSFNSLDALKIIVAKNIKVPFILVTGTMSEEFAVNVMKEGAGDYVQKNQLHRLPDAINKALDKLRYEKLRQKFLYEAISNEAYMLEAEGIAHYGSWEIDMINKKLKLSKEGYNILGYKPGEPEPSYENIFQKIHPSEVNNLQQLIRQVFSNARLTKTSHHFHLADHDGLSKVIKIEFVIKRNNSNEVIRINGFIQDVTQMITLEDRLLETEELFNLLADSNDQKAILVLDSQGKIVKSNKAVLKNWGYDTIDIINQFFSIFFDKAVSNVAEDHLRMSRESGTFESRNSLVKKDGSRVLANVTVTTLNNKLGILNGYMIIMTKISLPVFAASVL